VRHDVTEVDWHVLDDRRGLIATAQIAAKVSQCERTCVVLGVSNAWQSPCAHHLKTKAKFVPSQMLALIWSSSIVGGIVHYISMINKRQHYFRTDLASG
jgi:hypothetical protein